MQHDHALGFAHDFDAHQLFLFGVARVELLDDGLLDGVAAQPVQVGDDDLVAERGEDVRLQGSQFPRRRMRAFRTTRAHGRADNAAHHFQDAFALIGAFQQLAPHTVDVLPLLVHHIVVFEDVFAGGEVLRFNGLLRFLDTPRDQA